MPERDFLDGLARHEGDARASLSEVPATIGAKPVHGTVNSIEAQQHAFGATVLVNGMWRIYRISDGEPFERWPIDAKELIATGAYSLQPVVE